LEIDPEDSECLNSYGNILALTSRNFEAIAAYEKSLRVAPNYPNPAIALGNLHLRLKNPVQAVSVYEACLRHNPQNKPLIIGFIHALKDAQRYEEARAVLKKLPPDPSLALVAGQIAAVNNQMPIARGAFAQALAHPPSSFMAFRNLVQLEWLSGGTEGAQKLIKDMTVQNPEAPMLYLGGADLLADMGEADEGIDLLEEAEQKFGEQPDIASARAKLWIELGEADAARVQAENALKGRPGELGAMAHYARAKLMLGDFDTALQVAKAAQMRQPNNQFWIAIEATALRGLGQTEAYNALYDYNLVRVYDLDAPPEYDNMEMFLSKLKAEMLALHEGEHFPLGQSLRGGTQTSRDLRFAKSRVIQDFFQALNQPISDYIQAMPQSGTHPLFRRKREGHRLTGAWSVRLSGGGFHVSHIHPEGWISSAFYIDVPSDIESEKNKAGWIEFGRPPFEVPGFDAEHSVMPTPGRLVLFPSYMWHGTVPIEGKRTRLTLPFDVVPS
ncbi:MAG: putative 2OG-Fe(II) oxygenase, partial [Maricaulaceae bacterium]